MINCIVKIDQYKISNKITRELGYRYYIINISTDFGNYVYNFILNLLLEIPYISFSCICTDSKSNIDIMCQYKNLRDAILRHILTEDYDNYIEFKI